MNLKECWSVIKTESNKRNPVTNVLLYAVQIISFVAIIALLPDVIWSLGLLNEPEWTMTEVYGKGSIPAWIAAVSTFIGNRYILKWNKTGVTILLISFFLICLPLMRNSYIEFAVFIGCLYGGLLIYWLSLLLKMDGVSLWQKCSGNYRKLNYTIISVVIFLAFLFPPMVGYAVGFKGKLYRNGCSCLDAHLNSSYYKKNAFGKVIAFSPLWRKEDWQRHFAAEKWFNASLYVVWTEPRYDFRNWGLKHIYANYICSLLKQGYLGEAKNKYQEALEYVSPADLSEEIARDHILKAYIDDYNALVSGLSNTNESDIKD